MISQDQSVGLAIVHNIKTEYFRKDDYESAMYDAQ
jgi:hypothetical protein